MHNHRSRGTLTGFLCLIFACLASCTVFVGSTPGEETPLFVQPTGAAPSPQVSSTLEPREAPAEVPPLPDLRLPLPGGLTLEAYPLATPPDTDSFRFTPLHHTQEEILDRHAEARVPLASFNNTYSANGMAMSTRAGNWQISAQEIYPTPPPEGQTGVPEVIIQVESSDEVLYETSAGPVSPISPLQGVWIYDQHWILEYVAVTTTFSETSNTIFTLPAGQLVQDGESINKTYDYDEAFAFQLLDGKPFYFYRTNAGIGVSYDGATSLLPFEEIPHYGCCSASLLNPRPFQSMVTFFAQADGTWYYAEIGLFSP